MLKRLTIQGFKSLHDVSVDFPRFSVLFGPNAAGKSNLLDAILALSRLGTQRTLADALAEPIRGYPTEAFAFPHGGLAELLSEQEVQFSLEADLTAQKATYRYRVVVEIQPGSGKLVTVDEYLSALSKRNRAKGTPAIEEVDGKLRVRRQSGGGKPRFEPLRQNYTILSDARLGGNAYPYIERVRNELADWRTYYLDPRLAMRVARPPSDVRDIGVLGEYVAPYLYKLKVEYPKHFAAIQRTLRSIIPSIEAIDVDLDKRRGTLDLLVRQDGTDYSSRIVSEGTLRVLALCAIAVNPRGGSLLAFEEPENGVHPRRLELIAQLLLSLALGQGRQVVVTTHSPLFCDAVLKQARSKPEEIGLFNVRRVGRASEIRPFDVAGPLFQDSEVAAALTSGTEDGLFESLLLRGWIDE